MNTDAAVPAPEAPVPGLSDERFLVTGSEGCIGSWVVATLATRAGAVVAADLSTSGRAIRSILGDDVPDTVRFAHGDVTQPGAIDRLIAHHGITRVVHAAALQIPFVAADPLRGADVNVLGTARVFEAVRASAGQVRGLSYASSSAVFGVEDPHRPDTLYGALKACNEASARFYARDYDTPSVGLRPCVVYGQNRDQGLTSALTTAIKAAVQGDRYTVPFGGALDVQFTQDVAWAFILAAMAEPDGAPVFDLHGEVVTVRRFLDVVTAVTGVAPDLLDVGDERLPGRMEFDDGPLREFLGALPKSSLDAGIANTVERYRHAVAAGHVLIAASSDV